MPFKSAQKRTQKKSAKVSKSIHKKRSEKQHKKSPSLQGAEWSAGVARKRMYQRPDGLFEKILVIDGKRVAFRARSEREVMQKIAAHREREEIGVTFDAAAAAWWKDKEPRLSPNTAPNYRLAMKRAVERFGTTPVKDLTPVSIRAYLEYLAHRGYARRTVNQHFVVLREICAFACERYNVMQNAAALVKLPDKLPQAKRKMPTQEEIEAIKRAADTPDGLFLNFLMYSGLRLGEALALTWADVDLEHEALHVRRSLYFAGRNQGELKAPKSDAGQRDVIYLKRLQALLEPHRGAPGAYVFGGDKPMSKRAYYCLLERYRRAGLDVTPHQLRHAYATLLFEAGIPEKTAQNLLGHAQLSTTVDVYTELREKKLEEAAQVLNDADF